MLGEVLQLDRPRGLDNGVREAHLSIIKKDFTFGTIIAANKATYARLT